MVKTTLRKAGKLYIERKYLSAPVLKSRLDWTKDRHFESHLASMFKLVSYGNHTVQFASVSEASSAYAWIKDEYPQYKNRINLNGNTIKFS